MSEQAQILARPAVVASPTAGRAARRSRRAGAALEPASIAGWRVAVGRIGVAIGLAFWWSRYWARIVEPLLIAFHAMPKLALAPIVVLVFGLELPSKVAMAVALTIVVTAITAYSGV